MYNSNQVLMIILIIMVTIGFIYYKYYYYTIYDESIHQIQPITNNNINNICDNKLISKYLKLNSEPNIDCFNNIESKNISKTPRIIWVYWENINRDSYPTFIKLCLETMGKHLKPKYNFILLNAQSIHTYLPDLREDFDNLKVAQKVDYYRIELLYRYGGIWIDADIIVLKDFDIIFEKLDSGYDYVGFGCTGYECSYGYFRPSNWVMASRPGSILMKKCLEKLNKKLDMRNKTQEQTDLTYHDYGKIIIWESLDELKPLGYNYYHFGSEYDGTRDKNKNWIHVNNFFNSKQTEFLDESKLLFIVLYNSEISNSNDYKWVYDCDELRIINGKEWICELFRKALN